MGGYHFFIYLYGLGIRIYALFNSKAKKFIQGRKAIFKNLPNTEGRKVVWFHCASLGEFDQALPIIENWNQDEFILITFFSPSGYEPKKKFKGADYICYLPLDTPANAKKFVQHFQPQQAFFVKYEFWLNYIDELSSIGASIFSLSTVLRPNQHFFKWYGKIFKMRLKKFSYFFVQNEDTKKLLIGLGIKKVEVTGDTRYDRVLSRKLNTTPNKYIKDWLEQEQAFIIGSSWAKDEETILPVLEKTTVKIIIAPHEVNKRNIQRLIQLLPKKHFCYSEVIQNKKMIPKDTQILVLDCIGVLAEAYYFGKHAYVGGAFGSGLHNILEPAAFGLPVIFGPKHEKFPEATTFISQGIAQSISNLNEFQQAFLDHETNHQDLKKSVDKLVQENKGAKDKIFKILQMIG